MRKILAIALLACSPSVFFSGNAHPLAHAETAPVVVVTSPACGQVLTQLAENTKLFAVERADASMYNARIPYKGSFEERYNRSLSLASYFGCKHAG